MGASLIPRPPGEVKSWPNHRKMEGELWVGDPASFTAGILGAGNPMVQAFRMAGLLTSCAMCEGSLGFSFLLSFTGTACRALTSTREVLCHFAKDSRSGALELKRRTCTLDIPRHLHRDPFSSRWC